MKINDSSVENLDCLLVFVPKYRNFYKPIGEHMFNVLLPMGLMSIADFAIRQGYKTRILHLGLEKINDCKFSVKDYLLKTNPKVVGLSLHWHYQCHDTIEAAKEIKRHNPDIFIILGGLTASYFHDEILRESDFIDAVIRGDGEVPLSYLLGKIAKGDRDFTNVPNLSWRKGKEIIVNEINYVATDNDLNKFNFNNFKLLENYKLYIRMKDSRGGRWIKGPVRTIYDKFLPNAYFPLFIHKGCAVSCSYCGGSKISQKITCGRENISIRSIGKVIESIKEAKGYGYKEIYLSYLPFSNYPGYFEQLFEAIKEERLPINYFLECWALPTPEVIKAYNGIRHPNSKLYIGISPETGSEEIRRVNKGFYYSNAELTERLKFIESLKIPVILYFSVGLPGETAEDIQATLNFKDFLRRNFNNIISISTVNPVLEPASLMYLNPDKYRVTRTRASFSDFISSSKDANRCGFLTPKLGYFKQDFDPPGRFNQLSKEDSLRNYLQDIICDSSCRVSDFIISDFFKTNAFFAKKIISRASRNICGVVSALRRLG